MLGVMKTRSRRRRTTRRRWVRRKKNPTLIHTSRKIQRRKRKRRTTTNRKRRTLWCQRHWKNYTARGVFTFIHHFAGSRDPLPKALRLEAIRQGIKIKIISVEKSNDTGDLSATEPYTIGIWGGHVGVTWMATMLGSHATLSRSWGIVLQPTCQAWSGRSPNPIGGRTTPIGNKPNVTKVQFWLVEL